MTKQAKTYAELTEAEKEQECICTHSYFSVDELEKMRTKRRTK